MSGPRSPGPIRARLQLFGRSGDVNRLVAAADLTVETGTQMAIVSGEAGIGKTSLANEAMAQLAENGWATHVGYCIEFADRSLPFGPIVSLLRSVLLDNLDDIDDLIGRRRNDLAGLLPEFASSDESDRGSLVGDVDRLFDAIAVCLTAAARRRPLALLVEDIHWADAATRDLAASLVRNLGTARVLLVVTERSGAISPRHPLRTWLAEHRRMPNVHYLGLEGLAASEVAEHAESVLKQDPDPALVEELIGRTGGNPYYCHELLVARRDGNDALPTSLAEFLTSRFERLEGPERQVLRAIAAAGGPVSHRMLAEMLPNLPVDELIRTLFDSSILVLEGSEYTFRHALMREAILRGVLPFEHEEMHRRVAEAILSDPKRGESLSDLAMLASHWDKADDPDRSLETAIRAANAAAAVAAYESAANLAAQALESWPHASAPQETTLLTRDLLLLQATDWLARCYRGDEAVERITEALATWGADLSAGRRALLNANMARIYWDLGKPTEAERVLHEARRIVPDEISPEVAQVHHRVSKHALANGHIEPAQESADRAIAIAAKVGPQIVLVEAMTTKALATGVCGDLDAGLALAAEARRLALDAGFVSQVANTYRTEMLMIVFVAGRTDACLGAIRSGLTYAEQHCGPRWRADFRLDLCLGYVEGGRLNDAEPLLKKLMEVELDDLRRLTVLQTAGLHSLASDSVESARTFLDDATEIADRYQSAQETGAQLKLLAELARREGRLGDAAQFIDRALEFQLAEDNLTYARESIVEKIRITRECLGAQRPGADQMLADLAGLIADFDGSGPANQAMRSLMELELADITGTLDVGAAQQTRSALEQVGYLIEAAEAQLLILGHQARDRSTDRDQLRADLHVLHELATTHGMVWLQKRTIALGRTADIKMVADQPSVLPNRLATELPHFLTPREVEVMSLLAEGLTNKKIGERLFVSPRTVSTHISNLLAKLGVGTRGEAAAAYHRLGLAQLIDLRDPERAVRTTG